MTADPRYPIGKYEPMPFSEATKKQWINEIRVTPADIEFTIQHLDKAQLDTPYREGGWTVQQLIGHIADSHFNSFSMALIVGQGYSVSQAQHSTADIDTGSGLIKCTFTTELRALIKSPASI